MSLTVNECTTLTCFANQVRRQEERARSTPLKKYKEQCPWCRGSGRIAPGTSCGPCLERGYAWRDESTITLEANSY